MGPKVRVWGTSVLLQRLAVGMKGRGGSPRNHTWLCCTDNTSSQQEGFTLRKTASFVALILEHRTTRQGMEEEPHKVGNLKLAQTELWRHATESYPVG